jgi:hypothetical protein
MMDIPPRGGALRIPNAHLPLGRKTSIVGVLRVPVPVNIGDPSVAFRFAKVRDFREAKGNS